MFSLSQGLNSQGGMIGFGLGGGAGAAEVGGAASSRLAGGSNVSGGGVWSPYEWQGEEPSYTPDQIWRDYSEGAVQLARRKRLHTARRRGQMRPRETFADALSSASLSAAPATPRGAIKKLLARGAVGLLAGYVLRKAGMSAGAAAVATGAAAAAVAPDELLWALVSAGVAYAGAQI
jgi:hypothetical protein